MGLKKFLISGNYTSPSPPVPARDYYIAAGASGDGLTSESPADISILDSAVYTSGDAVYFNCGDEFYLKTVQMSAVNGFTIGAFGSGDKPKLRGSLPISGSWNNVGGGIYSKVLSQAPNWIYVDDVAAKKAASSWIQSTAIVSSTVIRGSSVTLNAFSSLIGAKIRVFTYPWLISDELTITNYDSGTGNITMNGSYAPFGLPAVGVYFIIYDQLQHITENNEWYFDPNTTTLYLKAASDPSTLDIRASYQSYGILPTGSNISISDVEMLHYNYAIYAPSSNATHVNIDNVFINDCEQRGIYMTGAHNSNLTNSEFRRCGSQAFYIIGDEAVAENNLCHTIGMNGNYPFGFCSAFVMSGNSVVARKNDVNNCAYNGCQVVGVNALAEKNSFTGFLKRMRDGAAIYTSGPSTPVQSLNYGGIFRNNIIRYTFEATENNLTNEATVGIYVDNRSENYTVEDNTIEGSVHYGVIANWNTRQSKLRRNHIVGATELQILLREDTDAADSPLFPNNNGNILEDANILACRLNTAACIEARQRNNVSNWNPFSSGGNSDNNYYIQPYGTTIAKYRQTETGVATNYTLATWRTKMSDDASSVERTNYIAYSNVSNALEEIKVEVNNTDAPVDFDVPAGYSDEEGNPFSNPVTIQPWTSLVYFKDSAA